MRFTLVSPVAGRLRAASSGFVFSLFALLLTSSFSCGVHVRQLLVWCVSPARLLPHGCKQHTMTNDDTSLSGGEALGALSHVFALRVEAAYNDSVDLSSFQVV